MELCAPPGLLSICRLRAEAGWPVPTPDATFFAAVRDGGELTIVCDDREAPVGARVEPGWRRLSVVGPLDLRETGILAALSKPLAAAGVAVFAVSTFDTDHLLVRARALDTAVAALTASGHTVDVQD